MRAAFGRDLLKRAVAVPSPSGSEGRLAALLAQAVASRVDEARVDDAGNLVARAGRGRLAVTFLGHLDTVPGHVPVETVGGRLYGRGSVDAKGSLCAALAALAAVPDPVRERLTVRVVGAVGEEAPGSVGARHAVRTLPVPDFLVVCEPSGWDRITLGYKGHLRLELSSEASGRHSAGPEASAADDLVAALNRLRAAVEAAAADEGAARAFDRLTATVLALESEHDGLVERARATVGLRLPPGWTEERVLESVGVGRGSDGIGRRVVEAVPAVRGARDGVLPRAFRVAIRRAGGRPGSVVKTGTSDWNVVAPHWNVPTLAYGPGDAALDHTPYESLDLAEYDASVAVIASALEALATATDGDLAGERATAEGAGTSALQSPDRS